MDILIDSFDEFDIWLTRYHSEKRKYINNYADEQMCGLYKKKLERIRAGLIVYVWRISGFRELRHGKKLAHFALNQALNEDYWAGSPYSVAEDSSKQVMTTVLSYLEMAKLAQTT